MSYIIWRLKKDKCVSSPCRGLPGIMAWRRGSAHVCHVNINMGVRLSLCGGGAVYGKNTRRLIIIILLHCAGRIGKQVLR